MERQKVAGHAARELNEQHSLQFFFGFDSTQDQKDSTKQIGEIDQAGLGLPTATTT